MKPNGDKYTGGFKRHLRDGDGRLVCANGDFYSGGWKQDKYDGHGEVTYASGAAYSGGWKLGAKHGEGVFVGGADSLSFEGEWKDDNPVGACGEYHVVQPSSARTKTNASSPRCPGCVDAGAGEVFDIAVDPSYQPPEAPDAGKGKKGKGKAKKGKKGAAPVVELPANYHMRPFLPVHAGGPLPALSVNVAYVVDEAGGKEAEEKAGGEEEGAPGGKEDDDEPKLPPRKLLDRRGCLFVDCSG